ncbi:MAG: myxococcus cysteine-rich repeat containing protein [archaeon]
MKRGNYFILILIIVLGLCLSSIVSAWTKTGITYTTDGSYSDVNSAFLDADSNDIINIPIGSFDWGNNKLTFNKKIILQGAGIASTTITSDTVDPMIDITSADASGCRITGFKLIKTSGSGIQISSVPVVDFRFDHIYFDYTINSDAIIIDYGTSNTKTTRTKGLIDNNIFEECRLNYHDITCADRYDWQIFADDRNLGGDDAIYVEDNTFRQDSYSVNRRFCDSDCGASFVIRYNNVSGRGLESHGVQDNHLYRSNLKYEIYRNTMDGQKSVGGTWNWVWLRSPTVMMFQNDAEDYGDNEIQISDYHVITGDVEGGLDPCNGGEPHDSNYGVSGSNGWLCMDQPGTGPDKSLRTADNQYTDQWPSPFYVWDNDYEGSSSNNVVTYNEDLIKEDRDYFRTGGAIGVSSGIYSNRPITCKEGQGYWCTDCGNWNKGTSTVVSDWDYAQGVLYRCGLIGDYYDGEQSDTWEEYYIPYTYPHPLRGESTCGNSIIEGTEECDDGNTINGDGCSSSCLNEVAICQPGDQYKIIDSTNIQACSCEQVDVQAAVDAASASDTVKVPAGSCVWDSSVTINKSIILKGQTIGCPEACDDGTIITGSGSNGLIYVNVLGDKTIDISGFTLDGNLFAGSIIKIVNTHLTNPLKNIIVHHNELKNSGSGAMSTSGLVFGLISNNKFSGNYFDFRLGGDNLNSWVLYPGIDNIGTSNYLYIENCISTGNAHYLISSGEGARWIYRHNTVIASNTTIALWDIHGDTKNYGVVAAEIYENDVDMRLYDHLVTAFDYRGGTALIYNNEIQTSDDIYGKVREEYGTPEQYCSDGWTTPNSQFVNNGYIWNNKDVTNNKIIKVIESDCEYDFIQEDTSWWDDAVGTPAGGLESPLNFYYDLSEYRSASCLDDDVYWETDTKKLYRCVGDNNWIFVYTPYTYPHPLTLLSSTCGNGIIENGEECDDGNAVDGDGCSSICKIESSCIHTSDTNCDGKVDIKELIFFITKYNNGEVAISELTSAIDVWKGF